MRTNVSCVCFLVVSLLWLAAAPFGAAAATADDVLALYSRFAAAQNAHDAKAISAQLIQSPKFLWVSDGKSIWGTAASIERMSMFQASEVWRVEPNLEQADVVEVNAETAFLHMPLELVIGAAAKPDRLAFLVSILCVKDHADWKIAALFTTARKP